MGWSNSRIREFVEDFPSLKDKLIYALLFYINLEKINKPVLDVYDVINILFSFGTEVTNRLQIFRKSESDFLERINYISEQLFYNHKDLLDNLVTSINNSADIVRNPAARLPSGIALNSKFRVSINNIDEFLNYARTADINKLADILFFEKKNPFANSNNEGITLTRSLIDICKKISLAKHAISDDIFRRHIFSLNNSFNNADEIVISKFSSGEANRDRIYKKIVLSLSDLNYNISEQLKENIRFEFDSGDTDIDSYKRAGQIPAGMHNFILNTGLFGESNYDELEWIREESDKTIKEYEKNLKKIRTSK